MHFMRVGSNKYAGPAGRMLTRRQVLAYRAGRKPEPVAEKPVVVAKPVAKKPAVKKAVVKKKAVVHKKRKKRSC